MTFKYKIRFLHLNLILPASFNPLKPSDSSVLNNESDLEVVDVFPVVDSSHILHQYVQLAAGHSRHIDSYDMVPFKNSSGHLEKKSG